MFANAQVQAHNVLRCSAPPHLLKLSRLTHIEVNQPLFNEVETMLAERGIDCKPARCAIG